MSSALLGSILLYLGSFLFGFGLANRNDLYDAAGVTGEAMLVASAIIYYYEIDIIDAIKALAEFVIGILGVILAICAFIYIAYIWIEGLSNLSKSPQDSRTIIILLAAILFVLLSKKS